MIKMNEISINRLSTMCRLCLASDGAMLDIFEFSTKMRNQLIANIIMSCAPVKITRSDRMPNLICQLCFTQLEKNHQFQMQIVESDETLRRHLQQLCASDKETKTEYSIQEPSEDPLYDTIAPVTVKCEPDVFNIGEPTSDNSIINENTPNEPMDDNFIILPKYAEDTVEITENVDGRQKKKHTSSNQSIIGNKKSKSSLKIHKRIHTGEKPHQCDVCKKCFGRLHDLNVHKLIHTGEKPYKCDVCSKCFIMLKQLNIHKRTHTGEKPYQCDLCKKCFSRLDHLQAHTRIHTGEKPYQCDSCKKCFRRLHHLKTHRLIHTGEKPYKCDMCEMCFTHSNSLTRHKASHS